MSQTFERECTVAIFYDGEGYLFDALSSFDFSQTFATTTTLRKTLHSKRTKPISVVSSRNPATVSLEVVGTNSYTEGLFYELVGLDRDGNTRFTLPDVMPVSPRFCEIYIINDSNIFKVENAAVEAVDVTTSRQQLVVFAVTFTASRITRVREVPRASGLRTQGDVLRPSPTQLILNNRLYNNIISAGTSFQQSVDWRSDRSLHDLGTIYSHSTATVSETSVSSTLSTTLDNKILTSDLPFISDIRLQNSGLLFSMDDIRVIKRFSTGQVFRENFDISLTEQSKNIVVEYGGLLI